MAAGLGSLQANRRAQAVNTLCRNGALANTDFSLVQNHLLIYSDVADVFQFDMSSRNLLGVRPVAFLKLEAKCLPSP